MSAVQSSNAEVATAALRAFYDIVFPADYDQLGYPYKSVLLGQALSSFNLGDCLDPESQVPQPLAAGLNLLVDADEATVNIPLPELTQEYDQDVSVQIVHWFGPANQLILATGEDHAHMADTGNIAESHHQPWIESMLPGLKLALESFLDIKS